MTLQELARKAARSAARLRADLGIGPTETLCPFDVAEHLGVVVRLVAIPSLEGMYSPVPKPTILVSVDRPSGRRRYTCGHELGHHVFRHGMRLDELVNHASATWSPEEFTAQYFSAALLMPKLGIECAFAKRKWAIADPTADMVFAIAQEFGVGFTTLVGHLERTLRRLPQRAADSLRRTALPKLRNRLAGFDVEHDLIVVDEYWSRRTIDVEVDDTIIVKTKMRFKGECAVSMSKPVPHLKATTQGTGELLHEAGRASIPIRVSGRGFAGLAKYRHLEEIAGEK